jgi:hypothetical protein
LQLIQRNLTAAITKDVEHPAAVRADGNNLTALVRVRAVPPDGERPAWRRRRRRRRRRGAARPCARDEWPVQAPPLLLSGSMVPAEKKRKKCTGRSGAAALDAAESPLSRISSFSAAASCQRPEGDGDRVNSREFWLLELH